MSVGYEIVILGMLVHGAAAFGVGFMWSLMPKRVIGLLGFALFYIVISIWYTATFNFQMLIYSTFFVSYVIVGLVGFTVGTFWLGIKGYYRKYQRGQKGGVET
ncbi:MAG: hypothetical protein OEY22_05470 [Candidatus Bathyarchaeota archaeon]|nr:hypothetical protein [Candidatus Bathyarchaeota archaeon]MDH5788323.1 hypothetical protein [Candidatus Bathyarchaeota archaeon]